MSPQRMMLILLLGLGTLMTSAQVSAEPGNKMGTHQKKKTITLMPAVQKIRESPVQKHKSGAKRGKTHVKVFSQRHW